MKEYNNLPVQFNERIHATSVDYALVFLIMLIMIFTKINPMYKYIIILLVWYSLNILPSFFKRGITLGKINSGTIVVNEDNSQVTMMTIHLRAFFILIAGGLTVGLYFLVAFILLTKRLDKRSVHDLIFKTKVVYQKSKISG